MMQTILIGKEGVGKMSYVLNYIDFHVKKDSLIYIVDPKGELRKSLEDKGKKITEKIYEADFVISDEEYVEVVEEQHFIYLTNGESPHYPYIKSAKEIILFPFERNDRIMNLLNLTNQQVDSLRPFEPVFFMK